MKIGNYYFSGGTATSLGGVSSEFNVPRAKYAFEEAVSIDPSILWGHYQLARIYFIEGDFERALEEANNELKENPENLRALYVRGLIYGFRELPGDLDRAADDLRRFTLWAPAEWAGYNDLLWILLKQEKYKEAKEVAQGALTYAQGGETNPWLWNSLGVAELNLKEYGAAENSFKKALSYAEELTEEDWFIAYPGNGRALAQSGLTQFKIGIRENIQKALKGG